MRPVDSSNAWVVIAAPVAVSAPAPIGSSEATDGTPSRVVPDAAGLYVGHGGEGAADMTGFNAVRPHCAPARSRLAYTSAPAHAGQRMDLYDRPDIVRPALEAYGLSVAATVYGDDSLSVFPIHAWRGNEAGVLDGLKLQF